MTSLPRWVAVLLLGISPSVAIAQDAFFSSAGVRGISSLVER
jgi:hypothetical protein